MDSKELDKRIDDTISPYCDRDANIAEAVDKVKQLISDAISQELESLKEAIAYQSRDGGDTVAVSSTRVAIDDAIYWSKRNLLGE